MTAREVLGHGAPQTALEELLGAPVELHELKHKPGRRRTLRAIGSRRRAIVKVYGSDRAPTVAERVQALAAGPAEPRVPEVLRLDPDRHMLVLSEVPGEPLTGSLLENDSAACLRAGRALGTWHRAFEGSSPRALQLHAPEREIDIIVKQAEPLPPPLRTSLIREARAARPAWSPRTVVHRDLYEEQVLVGDCIGLIDVDDAALGPPELDLGNFAAHADLLGVRRKRDLSPGLTAFMCGYAEEGPSLDRNLLGTCRRLALLRLVCIHRMPELMDLAGSRTMEVV